MYLSISVIQRMFCARINFFLSIIKQENCICMHFHHLYFNNKKLQDMRAYKSAITIHGKFKRQQIITFSIQVRQCAVYWLYAASRSDENHINLLHHPPELLHYYYYYYRNIRFYNSFLFISSNWISIKYFVNYNEIDTMEVLQATEFFTVLSCIDFH